MTATSLRMFSAARLLMLVGSLVAAPGSAQLLPAPTLVDPSNGASGVPTAAAFDWNSVSGANRYWLTVATSSGTLPTNPSATSCPGCVISCVTTSSAHTAGNSCTSGSSQVLAQNTTYHWKVQGYNTDGTEGNYSSTRSFTTTGGLLPAPSLVDPSNGATGVPTATEFDWNSVSGANRYWLTVATSSGSLPTSPSATSCPGCIISCVTTSTAHTAGSSCTSGSSQVLGAATTYHWKVQGYNTNGTQGNYSSTRSFTTAGGLLPAPALVDPSNGATGVPAATTFDWNSVSGANRYWLTVATSSGSLPTNPSATTCPGCVISCVTTSTAHTAGSSCTSGSSQVLAQNTTYHWKVQGYNTNGTQGNYSSSRSFTTGGLLPAPVLVDPSNGATGVGTAAAFDWNSVSGANRYWLTVATSTAALPTDPNATTCPGCTISCVTTSTAHTAGGSCTSGASQILGQNTTYHWKVQGYNSDGTQGNYSTSRSFTTTGGLLPAPSLVAPTNGSTGVATSPAFSWGSVAGANRYWLTVATSSATLPTDPNATSCPGCTISCVTTSTAHTAGASCTSGSSQTLGAQTTYHWKVQGYNTGGTQGNYSSTWSFTTAGSAPPATPIPLAPGLANSPGLEISSTTPSFFWQAAAGATEYDLYVSRRSGSSYSLVFDSEVDWGPAITGTSFAFPAGVLAPGNEYRWNMRARNAAGASDFSSRLYFYVTGSGTLAAPIPMSPGGASYPGTSLSSVPSLFSWQQAQGASSYAIRIHRRQGSSYVEVFDSQTDHAGSIVASPFSLPSGFLSQGNEYRWEIRAGNASGQSPFSAPRYFSVTGPSAILPPLSVSPGTENAPGPPVLPDQTFELAWLNATSSIAEGGNPFDLFEVLLEVQTGSGGWQAVLAGATTAATGWSVPTGTVPDGSAFRWCVRGRDAATGEWSECSTRRYCLAPGYEVNYSFRFPLGEGEGPTTAQHLYERERIPGIELPRVVYDADGDGDVDFWLKTPHGAVQNFKLADQASVECYANHPTANNLDPSTGCGFCTGPACCSSPAAVAHPGEDWAGSAGQDVRAIGYGVVMYAECSPGSGFGYAVAIAHQLPSGEFLTSFYAHMQDKLAVAADDFVVPGQVIGQVGGSGGECLPNAYDPHLHFEIRKPRFLNSDGLPTPSICQPPEAAWPLWPASAAACDGWDYQCDGGRGLLEHYYEEPWLRLRGAFADGFEFGDTSLWGGDP